MRHQPKWSKQEVQVQEDNIKLKKIQVDSSLEEVNQVAKSLNKKEKVKKERKESRSVADFI